MDPKTIVLDRGNDTSVTIHKHGATITSWKVAGVEMLFLSSKAIFDGNTPIRGGIPIVFPHHTHCPGQAPLHPQPLKKTGTHQHISRNHITISIKL